MNEPVSITCVGAGLLDVLMSGKVFKAHSDQGEMVEEFHLGEKYEVEEVTMSTGGGATNSAVTFARQGMRAVFMGKLGHDPAGQSVIADLKKERVDCSQVIYGDNLHTGYSTIIISPKGERVALIHRGASNQYGKTDFDVSKIKTDWLLVTSMAGSMETIEMLVDYAKHSHIKIALIPGKGELSHPEKLKSIAQGVAIFSANKEETETLVDGEGIEELAINMSRLTSGIAVVTDGPNGVATSDGKYVCRAGMYEDVPVIDRLGAGDAFASGFVSAIANGKTMQDAITIGSANSTSVVSFIGAKTGILTADADIHAMDIQTWEV